MSKQIYPIAETFHVSAKVKRDIGRAAKRLGRTRSELIRSVVEPFVQRVLTEADTPSKALSA